MNRVRRLPAFLAIFATLCAIGRAEVKLPHVIAENMVLQQGDNIPLWGWADAGEPVIVKFGGKSYETIPQNRRWEVRLNGLKPGGPFTMTIAGRNTIEFKNVLVGEVWVCSGQSNMAFPLKASSGGEEEVSRSSDPRIRLFQVPTRAEPKALDDITEGSWVECGPESAAGFSAVGYYFGKALAKARGVPIGLINSSFGGSPAVGWASPARLKSDPALRQWLDDFDIQVADYEATKDLKQKEFEAVLKKFEKQAAAKPAATKPARRGPGRGPDAPRPPRDPHTNSGAPGGLYNAMIAPIIPFAIRGAIWYQGESDANRYERYPAIFHAVIESWRQTWGRGEFPFLLVQLAGFSGKGSGGANSPTQVDLNWPYLRETQTDTLKQVKNIGMAVATDVGDPADIHPKRKQPVGERLALAARAIAYGEKIEYSGPIFKALKIKKGQAEVSFDHARKGLITQGGAALKGFEICGADRVWKPANAEIKSGKVVVSSPEIVNPVAVRYAWTGAPDANLCNKEVLPASSFRTDRVAEPESSVPAPTPGGRGR